MPALQLAIWRKLGALDQVWATEAHEDMALSPDVQGWSENAAALTHRDSKGAVLAQGDTVVLIKDLPVKGAGFNSTTNKTVYKAA